MGAPTWPNARRTVQQVLLVDRFPPHRHRPLDALVRDRWLTNRALPPIVLRDPDALPGRRLIASAPPTRLPVAQVLLEVLGIRLRRDPIDSRSTRLARLAVGLVPKVRVDEMREGRQHPVGIVGGRHCTALKFWCDGWCSHGSSRLSVQLRVMPGAAFPPGGRWGLTSPPSPVLGAAMTATLPISGRFACRSRPDTVRAPVVRGFRFRLVARGKPPGATPGVLRQPAPQTGNCCKETGGSPQFPSDPSRDLPRSQTPVVSWALALSRPGLRPSGQWKPSAFPSIPP